MAIRTINGRDVNTTPTSNEKLSVAVSSEEAKSFAIDKKQIDNNYNVEEQTKHEEHELRTDPDIEDQRTEQTMRRHWNPSVHHYHVAAKRLST